MSKYRNDTEIIADILENRNPQEAFKELIIKYQKPLYWHIRKIVIDHDDTDDILQNTFIKAWHSIREFKQQSKLYTWLYRIATNEALMFLRKRKRRFFTSFEDEIIQKLTTDPFFDGDEADLNFQKAILSLPTKQRIVFNMRYFDEMSYEEMSEILNTSVGALKASYHHAVKKLQKILKDAISFYDSE